MSTETSRIAAVPNSAHVRVSRGPLVGPVLTRVVAMIAARADCPVDRLEEALLVTDAFAAHAPAHALSGHVEMLVASHEGAMDLSVGPFAADGASVVLREAQVPGLGNVVERLADEVRVVTDEAGERLVATIAFRK